MLQPPNKKRLVGHSKFRVVASAVLREALQEGQ
jgi:hypothetical protein